MSGSFMSDVGQANYAGQQFVCATRIRNVSRLIFRIGRSSYIAFSSSCGLVTRRSVSLISRVAGLTTFERAIQNEVDRPLCKLSEILFLYARKSGPSG